MREIKFRVWHRKEKKMYYRGYQKFSHVLLCEDDGGTEEGNGIPAKRASYEECEFLESTGLIDKKGVEIYEGDRIKIQTPYRVVEGIVPDVPDMFRSRNIHPLEALLKEHDIHAEDIVEMEVIGNAYEQA